MATPQRRVAKGVSRREFVDLANKVDECSYQLDLQFTRIAQLQAELDHIRTAWANVKNVKTGTDDT